MAKGLVLMDVRHQSDKTRAHLEYLPRARADLGRVGSKRVTPLLVLDRQLVTVDFLETIITLLSVAGCSVGMEPMTELRIHLELA